MSDIKTRILRYMSLMKKMFVFNIYIVQEVTLSCYFSYAERSIMIVGHTVRDNRNWGRTIGIGKGQWEMVTGNAVW